VAWRKKSEIIIEEIGQPSGVSAARQLKCNGGWLKVS